MRPVLLVSALVSSLTAPSSSLHPNNGLPTIGDIDSNSKSYGPSCSQTFERLSLRLVQVTVDGVDGPPLVDAEPNPDADGVAATNILSTTLRPDVVDHSYVVLTIALSPAAGVGTPFNESFHAQ